MQILITEDGARITHLHRQYPSEEDTPLFYRRVESAPGFHAAVHIQKGTGTAMQRAPKNRLLTAIEYGNNRCAPLC